MTGNQFFLLLICGIALWGFIKTQARRRAEEALVQSLSTVNGQESAHVLLSFDRRAGIAISRDAKAVCLAGGNWINAEVFDISEVLGAELYIDGECETSTSRSSQIAGAAVGGLLLGGVGLIVGGLSGKKKTNRKVSSVEVRVTIDDTNNPLHDVQLLRREVSRNSPEAKQVIEEARLFHAQLDVAIKRADQAQREVEHQRLLEAQGGRTNVPTLSIAAELRALGELKASGELSEAEYQSLRSKLLA
ncbi:SHOCT domain-containing protein [Achromobacter sp. AGC39]